jgi:hypothetical protein
MLSMFLRWLLLLSIATMVAATSRPAEFLREQRTLSIGGKSEQWQLVWEGRPKQICGPQDVEMAATCPCTGFAYGEMGKLALVRKQGGKEVDRLALGQFFDDLPASDSAGLAAMQWRPLEPGDMHLLGEPATPAFLAQVQKRPGPHTIVPGDYDKDGTAAEFLVQISAGPCGHTDYMLVGTSRARPKLHGFGSADHPGDLLTMPGSAWQALLTARGPTSVTAWPCGDHGSDVRHELILSASAGAIRVRQQTWSCPDEGQAERLLREEQL